MSELEDARRRNLRRLLKPRSIALIGGRTLEPSIELLRRAGYQGTVHVVNPFHREIGGIRCVPRISELADAPDASFLNVNRQVTIQAIAELAKLGAAGAVCFAAGFGEMGASGKSFESELVNASGDLAVVGPNSNGLLNRLERFALWPMADHDPIVVERGVAVISQSGGVAYTFMKDLRGLRPAVIASTGNQTLLDASDWLAVLSEDPRITAIGLFIEGPGNVPALARAAELAHLNNKPVVVLKSGRSALGAEMAKTHTGALAGDDDLFDAFCQRMCLTRVATLPLLLETLKAVDLLGGLRGNRMAVLTASGGTRALFADAASNNKIALPPISARTAAALRPQLPEFAHVSNPLDHNAAYTGFDGLSLENEPALYECFRTMLLDGYDVGLLNIDEGDSEEGSPTLRAWINAARDTGTPAAIASTIPDNMTKYVQRICRDAGVAPLQGLEDAVAAIAAAVRHGSRKDIGSTELATLPPTSSSSLPHIVDEWSSKAALEAAGVPFPQRQRTDANGVADAAALIGFPVVLKAVGSAIPHKNKVGAVAINLRDKAAVVAALMEMQRSLRTAGIVPESYLVEKMILESSAEIIIGVKSSQVYGLALVIGAGGINVENTDDSEVLLLPARRVDFERAINRVKAMASFGDVTKSTLADIAESIASYVLTNVKTVSALDINPLIVGKNGNVVAVDALIELRAGV